MTLIRLRGVEKTYGGKLVLDALDFEVGERARVGLVGPNGSGKSTLLKIIAGLEDADSGDVELRRGVKCAYLPQRIDGDERTPLEIVRAARPDIQTLEDDLQRCARMVGSPEAMADMGRMQRALERQENLLRRFRELGGPGFEGEARSRLSELAGLDRSAMSRPTCELSGGQRKLVVLAACLMQRPGILLLDEPETHLDSSKRERLEGIVARFEGAVVVVSHDRYLLDETISEIAELDGGKIVMWPGNYSAYSVAKELHLERRRQLYVTQRKEISRLEEAVKRFQEWAHRTEDVRHAKQARSKQKQIERMEKVERPVLERRRMGLDLRSGVRGGQKAVELRGASVAFGEEPVLLDVDLTVMRGERVGVVGANGAGKSVLARTLAGEIEPAEGERWIGPSISVGHLAQEHEPLPKSISPLEIVRKAKPMYEDEAVRLLLRFLFRYDQIRESADKLSGGERTRLELLVLMLSESNLLVLDEPTNHLDIEAMEVLESSLESYDGTVVFVSHDRYFLDRTADRILDVRDGEVLSHVGGYSAWRERMSNVVSLASRRK